MKKFSLPNGFLSAGLFCGIKQSKKKDLGIIYSELPCSVAGVFTTNSVKAHCVIDNQSVIKSGNSIKTIIVNSGNANACTGEAGLDSLREIKKSLAELFSIDINSILTASTGIIGIPLPNERVINSLTVLKSQLSNNYKDFAEAILTTDLDIKFSEKQIGNKSKIIGVTKGSGMINPQMATTLTFIVTDLEIDSKELQNSLDIANAKSFNQITVDGDTSTNDMILVLANGASGEKVGKEISHEDFHAALTEINVDLAKQVVIDGEGATKIFEIQIKGSSTEEEARIMAKGVANSLLVKTAIFGNDPNWGRFLAAAGQYGQVDMEKARLKIFDTVLLDAGKVCEYDKPALSAQMKEAKEIKVDLIVGEKIQNQGLAWGCDLSYEYVRINAEYTT